MKNKHLYENKIKKILYKVFSGLNYIHEVGMVHRDLKPDNILYKDKGADSEIAIIDFGFARKFNKYKKMHSTVGTPYFVAPEVI